MESSLPCSRYHIRYIGNQLLDSWKWCDRWGIRTSCSLDFGGRRKSGSHEQDGENQHARANIGDTTCGYSEPARLNELVEHDGEDKTATATSRNDDTHSEAPSPLKVVSDDSDTREEEESQSDSCQDSLGENDLVKGVLVGE